MRFDRVVELLQNDQLARALENQGELDQELRALLKLLRSDDQSLRDTILSQEVQHVYLKVKEFERIQIEIQTATNRGGNIKPLAVPESKLADATEKLLQSLSGNTGQKGEPKDGQGGKPKDGQAGSPKDGQGGKPKDGQGGKPTDGKMSGGAQPGDQKDQPHSTNPNPNPIQKDLEQAEKDMRQAQLELNQTDRDKATDKEQDVLNDFHKIEAKLEEILRQLREKAVQRTLAMLEVQFTKMLEMQREVYDQTVILDKVPQRERTHVDEAAAGTQAGKETEIVAAVDKCLLMLKDDGTSKALPEMIAQAARTCSGSSAF